MNEGGRREVERVIKERETYHEVKSPMTQKRDENVLRACGCYYYFSSFVHFLFLTGLAARLPCEWLFNSVRVIVVLLRVRETPCKCKLSATAALKKKKLNSHEQTNNNKNF